MEGKDGNREDIVHFPQKKNKPLLKGTIRVVKKEANLFFL
jgi:hypothetical protein